MIFTLAFFLLLCTKTFKEKECRNKLSSCRHVMKRNKAKQKQSIELWNNATMQQVLLYFNSALLQSVM